MTNALVKIFGERNTATNALARVVTSNSRSRLLPSTENDLDRTASKNAWSGQRPADVEAALDRIYDGVADTMAWKHAATNFDDVSPFQGVLVLFCMKHPGSWLASLYRNPYHLLGDLPPNLDEFIDFQWRTVKRERLGEATMRPLELYNSKLDSYLNFARQLSSVGATSAFIRQEDLLLDPDRVFRTLGPLLASPRQRFRMRQRSAKNGWLPLFVTKHYYAKQRWKDSIEGLEQEINRQVDWDLFGQLGYEPL